MRRRWVPPDPFAHTVRLPALNAVAVAQRHRRIVSRRTAWCWACWRRCSILAEPLWIVRHLNIPLIQDLSNYSV